eukprot:363810-Chlamydomonas_euryale.AAC.3
MFTLMRNLGRLILHKTCLSRPPFSAYYDYRGRGRPEAEDMHARKCPQPEAEGHLCACIIEAKGRPRPRQALQASTCSLDECFAHRPPRLGFTLG